MSLGGRARLQAAVAAGLLLASLAVPISAAVPPASAPMDRVLRLLVDNGGYVDDTFYRSLAGHRPGDVYYLVELRAPASESILRALERAGARVRHRYDAIPWLAVASPASAVTAVAAVDGVAGLHADAVHEVQVSTAGADSASIQAKRGTGDLHAPALWDRGITGAGVVVGVADTGIDSSHPDLDDLDWLTWDDPGEGKLAAFFDCTFGTTARIFVPSAPGGCRSTPAYDDHGHGTHVAGIAAGSAEGDGGGQRGLYPGLAPGASLAGAKVLSGAGSGLNSDVMAGFEALAREREDGGAGADIVNASLGSGRFYGAPLFYADQVTNHDPAAIHVNALAQKHNVLFVISAGNSGPTLQSVGSPGVASQALTVAASASDFDLAAPVEETAHGEFGEIRPEAAAAGASSLADFSSRGPSGDRLIKPEITAPGVYWIAAESSQGSEMRAIDAAHDHAFSADPRYAVLSGTSMSAPAAAGAAALVIDGWKQATGGAPWAYFDVKAALVNTAGDRGYEGAVAGSIGTITAKLRGQQPADVYPIRNDRWVGVTGEGAGRIDPEAALAAMTSGVIAFTAQRGALDVHELQPTWSVGALDPGGSAATDVLLKGGPALPPGATVRFEVLQEQQPAGVRPLPAAWVRLPGIASVPPSGATAVGLGVQGPPDAAPGLYAGVVQGAVEVDGRAIQRLRIPVQLDVAVTDGPGEGGTVLSGTDLWASGATDYGYVGGAASDVATDWLAWPVRIPKGFSRLDLSAWDPRGQDALDLFVFDERGRELDSSVSFFLDHAVPGVVLVAPTDEANPATVTVGDGDDSKNDLEPGDTVWVVLSLTKPADPGTFGSYELVVDLVAGAGPATATAPPERIASGTHAWWSGNAVDAKPTLTRAYDLRRVTAAQQPSLRFTTWYDLEDGYDWAFVLVSADGGATWESLPTTSDDGSGTTTTRSPLEGTYANRRTHEHGLTGASGHRPTFTGAPVFPPGLSEQVADLSAHAGKRLLLRFAVETDAYTAHDGFYVDDVSVVDGSGAALAVAAPNPDDAEAPRGWQAAGGFRLAAAESDG